MQTMTLSMGQRRETVPLQLPDRLKSAACCVALIAQTTTVPARHQMHVPARFALPSTIEEDCTGILEPSPEFLERHDVLVARSLSTLSTRSERTMVRILNPSPTPATLYEGEKVHGTVAVTTG